MIVTFVRSEMLMQYVLSINHQYMCVCVCVCGGGGCDHVCFLFKMCTDNDKGSLLFGEHAAFLEYIHRVHSPAKVWKANQFTLGAWKPTEKKCLYKKRKCLLYLHEKS